MSTTTRICHSGGPPLWDADDNPQPTSDQLIVLVESGDAVRRHGHRVDSRYVEVFWLPVLGPSATWLIRRIALEAKLAGRQILELSHQAMSESIGLQGRPDQASRSWFRTLNRLQRFGVIGELDAGIIRFPTHLPDLSGPQLQRLPADLQRRHRIELGGREVQR